MDRRKAAAFVCVLGIASYASGYGFLTLFLGIIGLGLTLGWF